MRVIGANRNFLAHVGQFDLAAITGRMFEEFAPDRRRSQADDESGPGGCRIQRAQILLRWEARNAAGDTVWFLVNKVPLHDPHGEVVGVLSTAEDITQTMSLEKQLLQSQKMEAIGTCRRHRP